MPRALSLLVLLGTGLPGLADEPAGKLVEEFWESALVDGVRVGSVHTHTRALEEGKRLRTTAELQLTFRRNGTLLRLRMDQATDETPAGKVVAVSMRQLHPGGRQLVLAGTVQKDALHVKVDGGRIERRLRWSEEVVGLRGLDRLFATRKPRPADRFTVLRFEPIYNTVVTVRVLVKDRETVALPEGKKSLLRVELTPDRLEGPNHSVQPPRSVWWLDDGFVPVRRQMELPGLGTVVLTRTRGQERTLSTAPPRSIDLGARTLIPLDRAIQRPYATRSAVYRVTVQEDEKPGTVFARDTHQEVGNLSGQTFELVVHPVRPGKGAEKPGPEYLASSHFIDWADERVKALARLAVGQESHPWKKALRIEGHVKRVMRVDQAAAFEPASKVARGLRGDCRQYALLTAALCRAEGIPARTAVGLLYVHKGKPQMGFHLWTEVCVDGRWLGLDATLGLGGVSATHLKIADQSWHGATSLLPLLPVERVLGKVRIEVVRAGP
jgi:transglutaminase-like putative cysteine protease